MKRVSIRRIASIVLSVVLLAAIATACGKEAAPAPAPAPAPTPPSPPETIEIKFATWAPEGDFAVEHYRWLADELSRRTDGRVKMELFLAASLGSTPELPENLQNGIADMAVFVPTHVPGLMPMAELMSVPLLIPTAPVMDYIGRHLVAEGLMDLQGVKILEIMGHEDIVLCMTERKVASLEDFKGVVLGTPGTFGPLLAELGGSEMMLPPPEIYTSVERGVVDGGTFGWALPYTFKMEKLLKYINTDPLGNDPWIIGINQNKWNSLPPEIQVIMLDLSRESNSKLTALIYAQNKKLYDHFDAQPGIELHTFNPGEYEKLVELGGILVQDKVAQLDSQGLPAKRAIEIIMTDLKALGTTK